MGTGAARDDMTHDGAGRSLTICGGGNAGHALAVVASQNFDGEIDWLVGSAARADVLRGGLTATGLRSTGVIQQSATRIRNISAEPAEVIPHAGLVLIVVPAFVHATVLARIGPYLSASTVLGCMPTRGGFEFDAVRLTTGDSRHCPTLVGLQTLPWSTRVTTPGQLVHVGAAKEEVVLAALPAVAGPRIAAALTETLGTRVKPTADFIGLTLGNPGQFIHPGLMYGAFGSWQGEEYEEDTIPLLYAQATEETGALVEQLSREAMAVAAAIEAQSDRELALDGVVIPMHEWLRRVYGGVTGDTSTVATCFRTGPIQARKAPMTELGPGRFVPNFEYRYMSEDVPFGLVATRALADLAGVRTPAIDEVIVWAQTVMHKSYLVGGRLEGPDAATLPLPQNHGLSSLSDLIAWYRDQTVSRAGAG
jgi:hypothetical protein